MRKRLFKIVLLVLAALVAVPLTRYRTLHPCGMLERELVADIEREAQRAREGVERAAGEHSDEAGDLARDIGGVVEGAAVGVATGAVRARVRRMSAWECTQELWETVGP